MGLGFTFLFLFLIRKGLGFTLINICLICFLSDRNPELVNLLVYFSCLLVKNPSFLI